MLDQVYHDNIQKAIIEKKYMFKVKKKEKEISMTIARRPSWKKICSMTSPNWGKKSRIHPEAKTWLKKNSMTTAGSPKWKIEDV